MMSPKPHDVWSMKFLFRLLLGCATGLVLISGASTLSTAQSNNEERKFKLREFKNMPVRVLGVKNLQSENWPNRIEIEIENISDKTIYFINAHLLFPDVPVPNGIAGVKLDFGNIENMDVAIQAKPEDEHLAPGETLTMVVDESYRKGLVTRQKGYPNLMKRIEFEFGIISFGDGTGWEGGSFLDLRKKKL